MVWIDDATFRALKAMKEDEIGRLTLARRAAEPQTAPGDGERRRTPAGGASVSEPRLQWTARTALPRGGLAAR